MPKILDTINKANDIKNIDSKDYKKLASEIRQFIIRNVSKTGGHFASNLGVIELTMALHLVLDFPKDKLIWDVGHQAYTHKILTGRKEGFKTLRHYKGMSGFPKIEESNCDAFNVGHSSTSISLALGFAKARDIQKEDYKIFAVIGDGALSGGMAYEALNNAARLNSNMVIVLNDNKMSISENVGGMANYLGKIRTGTTYSTFKTNVEKGLRNVPVIGDGLADRIKKSKDSLKSLFIPGMLFEDMGLTYIGPIDGHNINQMVYAFNNASKAKGPVIVHVVTQKGKGYKLAEKNPSKFHGVGSFKTKTGESAVLEDCIDYTTSFAYKMIDLASKDDKVVAVSAAMLSGTGLSYFQEKFEDRLFDVGIAEEHARVDVNQRVDIIERIHKEVRVDLIFQIDQLGLLDVMLHLGQHLIVAYRLEYHHNTHIQTTHKHTQQQIDVQRQIAKNPPLREQIGLVDVDVVQVLVECDRRKDYHRYTDCR